MSMLANLARKWTYSVESPGMGRLLYREGNREYTFPIYEEEGELVLVDVPSSQRIHYFFNWYGHPHDFSREARERILPRIVEHLQGIGAQVRVFERGGEAGEGFEFHPELFAARARAADLLAEAGCALLDDYTAIDVVHEDYGLEICGIPDERRLRRIAQVLQRAFPHWHHQNIAQEEQGRDPGWALALCMFPSRLSGLEWSDED